MSWEGFWADVLGDWSQDEGLGPVSCREASWRCAPCTELPGPQGVLGRLRV